MARPARTVKRAARHPRRRYTLGVAKREPHVVLGIDPADAGPDQGGVAKLARQHHPDLTGDDPEASRIATRQMAEINEAYAAMTRAEYRPAAAALGAAGDAGASIEDGAAASGRPAEAAPDAAGHRAGSTCQGPSGRATRRSVRPPPGAAAQPQASAASRRCAGRPSNASRPG